MTRAILVVAFVWRKRKIRKAWDVDHTNTSVGVPLYSLRVLKREEPNAFW